MKSPIADETRSAGSTNSMPETVDHLLLVDVGDAAVDDASLDDQRTVAERQPEVVKGIEVERKTGFDLRAAAADLLDRHRLEDHHLAVQLAEDLQALGVAFVVRRRHSARL